MAKSCALSFFFFFLLLSSCLAYRQQPQQNECQLDRLEALEPDELLRSEGGQIETWNPNQDQFQCAGVAISRCTLEGNALRLPSYVNTPQLMYIQEGNGIYGVVFPGCAETFEEPQQQQKQSSRSQDRHQKIRYFKQGDIIAIPAGVPHWFYNNGNSRVVIIALLDTNSDQNQLDQNPRRFYLAGNQQQEFLKYSQQQQQQQGGRVGQQGKHQQEQEQGNIFSGFDDEWLVQTFNIDRETVKKLKGQQDRREGSAGIIRVKGEFSVIAPHMRQQQQQQQQGRQEEEEEQSRPQRRGRRGQSQSQSESESESQSENGLEETICTMKLRENIGQSSQADIYNPDAGSISTVNSLSLPVLRWLRLSAEQGTLYRNAMYVPHYNLNAHSIIYVLKGSARLQVVDANGNTLFNRELKQGQVLTVPQNYAVAARSLSERFEYVTFKTNDRAMMATLAGRTSVLNALPEQVLKEAYQLRGEQAYRLKRNNQNVFLVAPRSSQMRAVA